MSDIDTVDTIAHDIYQKYESNRVTGRQETYLHEDLHDYMVEPLAGFARGFRFNDNSSAIVNANGTGVHFYADDVRDPPFAFAEIDWEACQKEVDEHCLASSLYKLSKHMSPEWTRDTLYHLRTHHQKMGSYTIHTLPDGSYVSSLYTVVYFIAKDNGIIYGWKSIPDGGMV